MAIKSSTKPERAVLPLRGATEFFFTRATLAELAGYKMKGHRQRAMCAAKLANMRQGE